MAGNLYEQGYYETGTASITQGQTVVTGQGTAWSQIVRPADDFGKHVGRPIPIASVDSDTQITLAYPWPGPTQAAAPYRVTFTPYHVAYRQALQEIGQLLSSGNVSALAGLVGAAGAVPMFTGPGVLDLVELGAGAFHDVTASPEDVTVDRLLKVGDNINFHRLRDSGAYYGPTAGRNIDTVPVGDVGLYSIGNPGAWPSGSTFFWVSTQRTYVTDAKLQVAIAYHASGAQEPAQWLRTASGDGSYGPWRSLTPLRSSSANGHCVRFADGTQICWVDSLALTNLSSATIGTSWTYPAAFFGSPSVNFAMLDVPAAGFREHSSRVLPNVGFSSIQLLQNSVWPDPTTIHVTASARGRWF